MLPKKYMLEDSLIPDVRDQGKLDICVAMAITAVMQIIYYKETGERRQFSPTFAAAVWRDPINRNMKSLVPETALGYAVQLGCPFEDDVGVLLQNPRAWKYVEEHPELYSKAEKILAYWEKTSGKKLCKIEALKKAIYENQLPQIAVVKESKSNHCVPVIGWDDDKEFIYVMNSWGNGIDHYSFKKFSQGYILTPRAGGNNMSVKKYSLAKDGEKSLSKNFKVKEFRCKDGSDEILISDELVELLQNIRNYFGKSVVITSAYRTKSHNAKCGGAKSSQHLCGTAADIKVEGVDPLVVARYAELVLGEKGGVGYYYNKNNFTHVDVRSKKARWKNGGTGDVSVRNHGMVDVGDIVTELEKRGIITDIALWMKRLSEDNNAYWLARKAAVLTKNKAVPTGHGEVKSIVSVLSRRGIITNTRLWNELLPEDVNLYWLAYKICNLTERERVLDENI